MVFSMQLALSLVCRLRCRYLLITVKPAAQTGDYSGLVMVTDKALGEVGFFYGNIDKFEDQAMHEHVPKADYALECGASDHALGTTVTTLPFSSATGATFYSRPRADEAGWSSVPRELTGYRDAFLTPSSSADLAGRVTGIVVVGALSCTLMITEALIELLEAAHSAGARVRFRWARRQVKSRIALQGTVRKLGTPGKHKQRRCPVQVCRPHGLQFAKQLARAPLAPLRPLGR